MNAGFDVFLTPGALAINRARLDHLVGLGLDLAGKRVLEVGCGIGLMTEPFMAAGCHVLSTDAAPANIVELKRRYPGRKAMVLDIDTVGADWGALGRFDIVFCYGTLYHLAEPAAALAQLAALCDGQLLLETVVSQGWSADINRVAEPLILNQAINAIGCRPTRPWVMKQLQSLFGHAYTTVTQPQFVDFVTNWDVIPHGGNLRAIFVGSREALSLPLLTPRLPRVHEHVVTESPAQRLIVDVGAHCGETTLHRAQSDPALIVHAFEPLPDLAAALSLASPANYVVHAAAIAEHDSIADFTRNSFDAASSLLPIDESVRSGWKGGEALRETEKFQVQTMRLDTFMAAAQIDKIDLLKIDAQGADLAVVKSAGDRLADIAEVQLECDMGERPLYAGSAGREEICAYMEERGFTCVGEELQSHGQEVNLTFTRPGTRGDVQFENVPAGSVADLGQFDTAGGAATWANDWLEVTTPEEQWAYAALIPLRTGSAWQGRRLVLEFACEWLAGTCEVGILNSEGSAFVMTASISADSGPGFALSAPQPERCSSIVIRNASPHGPSACRLRLISAALAAQYVERRIPVQY